MGKITITFEKTQSMRGADVTLAVTEFDGEQVLLGKHYQSGLCWNVIDMVRVQLSLDEWKQKLIKDLKEGE